MISNDLEDIVESSGIPLREHESIEEYIRRLGDEIAAPIESQNEVVSAVQKSAFAPEPTLTQTEKEALHEFKSLVANANFQSEDAAEGSDRESEMESAVERHSDAQEVSKSSTTVADGHEVPEESASSTQLNGVDTGSGSSTMSYRRRIFPYRPDNLSISLTRG